jgi:hypothetical protein
MNAALSKKELSNNQIEVSKHNRLQSLNKGQEKSKIGKQL